MSQFNAARSLVAVLGGAVIGPLLGQLLEGLLVKTIAGPATMEAFFQARNQPAMLAGTLVVHAAAAVLVGYVIAKIAGIGEISHAGLAAALVTLSFAKQFVMDGNPGRYPVWMQAALPAITSAAMLAAASVRAKARVLQETS